MLISLQTLNTNTQINNLSKINIQYGEFNYLLHENEIFPNNKITTTKYNIFSFLPKSLIIQFHKIANIYFLMISILCFFPFSPFNPRGWVSTFALVLIVSMIKEGYEDYQRYKQDKESNGKIVLKFVKNSFEAFESWSIMPGDIIYVKKDQIFTTDTLIIKSSDMSGFCYCCLGCRSCNSKSVRNNIIT